MKFFSLEITEELQARSITKEEEATFFENPGKGKPTKPTTKPFPIKHY